MLNLAYREFKFPDLHNNFKHLVSETISNLDKKGIDVEKTMYSTVSDFNGAYPEYVELINASKSNGDIDWGTDHEKNAMKFLMEDIKLEKSFKKVNLYIKYNIIILAVMTLLSGLSIDNSMFSLELASMKASIAESFTSNAASSVPSHVKIDAANDLKWPKNLILAVVWLGLFLGLLKMILVPFRYIIKGTECNKTLFGIGGSIKIREKKIIDRLRANKERRDEQAVELNVND